MSPYNNSTDFPYILKNKIDNWEILKYTKDQWCDAFEDKILKFRKGDKVYRKSPYWEKSCETKKLSLKQFFQLSEKKSDDWLYFDYQYMKDILSKDSQIFNGIQWADLNLHDFKGQDSTLWIGNEGAHTPCHMDSYGTNFVAQIFGRKLWILIPPEEIDQMNPTRIPYEESTIYSSHNFYTPNNNLLNIKKAYKVILSPGEILYIPRHWWHYVENLELAISVNVWAPMEIDHESRLEESLIRHFVFNTCQDLSVDEAKHLLNPNEYSLLEENSTYTIIENCIKNCYNFRVNEKAEKHASTRCDFLCNNEKKQLFPYDLELYVRNKSELHNYNLKEYSNCSDKLSSKVLLAKSLINAYSHPKNIVSIKEELMKNYFRL